VMVNVRPELLEELKTRAELEGVERLVAGAVVVRRAPDGSVQLLALDRPATDSWGGIEELPSGQVESGETLLDALERELEEETGLAPEVVAGHLFSFDYRSGSGKKSRQLNFLVVSSGCHVRTSHEHSGYRWLSYPQLAGSRLTRNIVQALAESWSELVAALPQSTEDQ
jgi:8-oxo-dGTP diphosphatase